MLSNLPRTLHESITSENYRENLRLQKKYPKVSYISIDISSDTKSCDEK